MSMAQVFRALSEALVNYAAHVHGKAPGARKREFALAVENPLSANRIAAEKKLGAALRAGEDEDVLAAIDNLEAIDAYIANRENAVTDAYTAAMVLLQKEHDGEWLPPFDHADPIKAASLEIERKIILRVPVAQVLGLAEAYGSVAEALEDE